MNGEPPAAADNSDEEIAALVRTLHETQQRLRDLTGGEVDAVVYPGGQSYLLHSAQEKLRRSEIVQRDYAATQSSILNALPAHIALLDHEGVIVSVNEGWLGFAGSNALESSASRVGQNYVEICERAQGQCAEEAYQAAAGIRAVLMREAGEFSLEYPCHSTTEKHWYRLMVSPIDLAGSRGAVVMHVNITERKQIEEALRESEERHRAVVESSLDAIVTIDHEGRITEFSPSAEQMFGRSRTEAVGQEMAELIVPPRLRTQHRRGLAHYLKTGESSILARRIELPAWHANGTDFPVELTITRMGSSEPPRFTGFVRDITERRHAQEALLTSEREQRELAKQLELERRRLVAAQAVAKVGSWETDLATMKVIWSEETHRIFGTDHLTFQPSHQSFLERVHPEDRHMVDAAFIESLSTQSAHSIEHRLLRTDGGTRFVEERWQVHHDEYGRPSRAVGTCQDITERKLAEIALRESEERFRSFMDYSPAAGWIADEEGRFRYVSPGYYRMFGGDRDLTNRSIRDVYAPEVAETYLSNNEIALRERRALETVEASYRADGTPGEFLVVKFPIDVPGRSPLLGGIALDITERKRIEAEVQRTTELLRVVAEGTPDAVYVKDRQGRYLLFNEAASRFVGRPIAEVLGKDDTALFGAEDARLVMESDQRVMESNQAQTTEEVLTAAETKRTYLATKAPYRDAKGNVIGVIGISRDITEQHQARETLQLSEERFRLLAKATNDTIWDWDMQANTVWWNEAIEILFGYRRGDLEPNVESWTSRLHPDDETRVRETFRDAVNQGQTTFVDEYRFRRANGSYAFVLGRGHIIRDAAGKPIRAVSAMTDLTDRIEAEQRIAQQAALIDQARDAIFVRDLDNHIVFWNLAAERIYGWKREEALGRRFDELLQADVEQLADADAELRAKGEWAGEMRKIDKAGTKVTLDCRWTLLRDDQNRPKSFLHIDTDITERKKLEEQFLRAQRMESVGTLAGGIAHDLNNVLGPILLALDIFKMRFPDEQSTELIDIIASSARRGADMVSQVLSFARGVEGQRVALRVRDLVSDIKKIADDTFLKHIEIRVIVPEDLWPVLGDPTQLHQVLLNLSVNARDAMPNGGMLTISAQNIEIDEHYAGLNLEAQPGSYVTIHVEDTGTGMPPVVLAKIFEPFFTTKELGRGTGLGLSTSMAIIKSHGGFIRVYSEPGKGTKFRLYLPAQTESFSKDSRKQESDTPRGNGETILVIDDESTVRTITKQTLEAFGYRAIVASDGADAVALYAQQGAEIAAALTDMMMPGIDGPSTIQVLRKMNPTLPIIAASGLSTDAQVSKAKDLGVKHFLSKPYTAEALLKILKQVLTGSA